MTYRPHDQLEPSLSLTASEIFNAECDDAAVGMSIVKPMILADGTNSRAYATVLRPSVVVCDVMYCGYTVRPRGKVTMESI